MSRLVARAENWERAKVALDNVNFAAFDYAAIKQALLDNAKLYYPEVFNDFIESSELIAIIESFAYVGELLSYRFDIDARENLLPAAQLRSSILRLAKLVSYNASRPIPARGLVKITSVSTTQTTFDPNGTNLTNRTISWNDNINSSWKSQFIQILQLALAQKFGTVNPGDRFQIADELFEIYQLNHTTLSSPTIPINTLINGRNTQLELVPVYYESEVGIVESRPSFESKMNILYGSDGLGDSSTTTGFFFYIKQGKLQRTRAEFNGVTPNQIYELAVPNVNDTDVWLNQVDPNTNFIVNDAQLINRSPHAGKSGEWVEVDTANSQNIIFNTNPYRHKYEVQTIENNGIRLNFGDGNFADIPNGTFDIWYRTSMDEDIVVPQSSVNNYTIQLPYEDQYGLNQTLTLTVSLIGTLQNASASESNEHIKVAAPALFYSQDRMVNGEDYNNFPLRDPSIVKLRTFNRTFVGDSRYVTWHDPSGYYENLFIFGQDGSLYFDDYEITFLATYQTDDLLITNSIIPLLGSIETFTFLTSRGVHSSQIHKILYESEYTSIINAVASPPVNVVVKIFWDRATNRYIAIRSGDEANLPSTAIIDPVYTIDVDRMSNTIMTYRYGTTLVLSSKNTNFIADNNTNKIIDFNTLRSLTDSVSILQANVSSSRTNLLSQDWKFVVTGNRVIDSGSNIGLPEINALTVLPIDNNFPQSLDPFDQSAYYPALYEVMCPKLQVTKSASAILMPIPVTNQSDIVVTDTATGDVIPNVTYNIDDNGLIESINISSAIPNGTSILISINEYVYFKWNVDNFSWDEMTGTSMENAIEYVQNINSNPDLYKRQMGRTGLNFNWTHIAPYYHLIDPSPSNINDIYIITKGYFTEYKRWLSSDNIASPQIPSNFNMRTTYDYLFKSKMISDTAVLHHGKFKLLFGNRADVSLRGRFKVIKHQDTTLTDNQIKNTIVSVTRSFFDITKWEFGETFYFSELAGAIHQALPNEISSVVFVPTLSAQQFGDGYQVRAKEDEVLMCDISNDIIDIVPEYSPKTLNF